MLIVHGILKSAMYSDHKSNNFNTGINTSKWHTHDRYRVFSHDVKAAILVSKNNKTAAMLVSQTNPLGVELFS